VGHVEDRWYVVRDGRKVPTSRYGGGRRWRVRYLVEGCERSLAFERKVDADRFLSTVTTDVLRRSYVDPTDRTTLTEYSRRWAAARPHRASTARRVASLIECHIVGSLGDRRLAAVLPSDVQSWAADRARVLAPSTLRTLVSLLRSIYASAVLDRLVPASPAVRVTLPSAHRERLVPLTVEQVRDLADAMPARNRAMVTVQAGTGLRIGELLALRITDVDFLRRTVRIEGQIVAGSRLRSEPKTPRSRRTVPLPTVVSEALARHVEDFPPGTDGALFTIRSGQPYSHVYYGSRIFPRAVQRAGLPKGTTSHDLRHHYASVLLAGGESVVAVAERLGHETAALVLKVYGHLVPGSEDRTRRAVDCAWNPAPGEAATAQGRPR